MTTVERIELELKKKGIKPATMSKDLGFSSGLFSQWRHSKQKPSSEKLYKIAEYLNVSIDYLTGNNEIPIEDTVKTYLFGTTNVDEEIFDQVKQYAQFLMQEKSNNNISASIPTAARNGSSPNIENINKNDIAETESKTDSQDY